jgi:hypothetical protein
LCDTFETEVAHLKAEMATTERTLRAARDQACKEHGRLLLGLLATEQQLIKRRAGNLALAFQKGDTALAQAMKAAQELVESRTAATRA